MISGGHRVHQTWRAFRLVSQLLQRRPGAWRNLLPPKLAWQTTTLRGPPSTLLDPPSSAHHRLDDDAFFCTIAASSSQRPLASNNINHSPLTNDWNLCAACPWQSNHPVVDGAATCVGTTSSISNPPLLTDDLLRNRFLQCQSQSVSKWTLEEVRHTPHNRWALLQQVWQDATRNASVLRGSVAST